LVTVEAMMTSKIAFSGVVVGVQPRIRLTRSFDQRSHTYQGYALRIDGNVHDEQRTVLVAIGEAGQENIKSAGDRVPVADRKPRSRNCTR
jgi:hypothetical protein